MVFERKNKSERKIISDLFYIAADAIYIHIYASCIYIIREEMTNENKIRAMISRDIELKKKEKRENEIHIVKFTWL